MSDSSHENFGVENLSRTFIQNNTTYSKAIEIRADVYPEIYSISTEENREFRSRKNALFNIRTVGTVGKK